MSKISTKQNFTAQNLGQMLRQKSIKKSVIFKRIML